MGMDKALRGESDIWIGQRRRLARYLVCALQGYFPVLVRTGARSLAVVYRTGGPHIGVSATLAVSRSEDGGCSWSDPVEVAPRWDDNRNPALGINAQGELIVAFWKARLHAYAPDPGGGGLRYTPGDAARWEAVPALYITRSADGGRTWCEPLPYSSELLSLASPYGRILSAPAGTLLMGVYGRRRATGTDPAQHSTILLRSHDGGHTWGDETLVATGYNETAYAYLPDGRLLAATRSDSGHVATLSSADDGRTWSTPVQLTRDGEHPADLCALANGHVLLTFGRRIRPMGCGALLSTDGGRTWDTTHEVLLAGDGVLNADLGYPSTVQLADGHIVTVLYYASGSELSQHWGGWGEISCQAIHYREEDLLGAA